MRFLGFLLLVVAIAALLAGRMSIAGAAVLFILGAALIGFGARGGRGDS